VSAIPKIDRINIGCGYDHRPGYLNVDMDPACKPDLLLKDNDYSGIAKRHYSELAAMDVLEHIHRAQTMATLLEWADLLKIGGHMTVETSSILGVARLLASGRKFADHYSCTIFLFGNQVHAGDFHLTGFTEATLRTYIVSAGFEISSFIERDNWIFLTQSMRNLDWTETLDTHRKSTNEVFLEAAYRAALNRLPEEPFRFMHLRDLAYGLSRRALLKTLFSSIERNYHVASEIGF